MTAPNHITGGFAVTGVVAALLNVNILENKLLIAVIVIASLLPDIDHTKSIIGKMFYPLAKFLQRHYGHRTITHSLLALVVLCFIVSIIQKAYCPETPITTVFAVAYASHLILDMITLQGIPLLYPFKRNAFVVPGNPNLRFQTNNVRHEMLAFSFFLVLGFSMKPLMANGFWTSYNSLFGTLKHLTSEYHKSQDLIKVQFKTQTGSEITQHEGLCVEVDEDHLVTITKSKQFRHYDSHEDMITDVFPRHTKMKYKLLQGEFQSITPDSLLRLFNMAKYTQFNIQGSKSFQYEHESIVSTHTTLKLDYPNTLTIRETKEKSKSRWIPTQKAAIKKREIALLQKTYQEELAQYHKDLNQYNLTKQKMETTTNYIDKEILMERFADMRLPNAPNSIQSRLERLHFDLEGIKASEQTRYQNHLNQERSGPLRFNGTFTKLQINGKDI